VKACGRTTVGVALSGGKDSSLAAALLLREGHRVRGYHLRLYSGGKDGAAQEAALRELAFRLKIPLFVLDLREEFREGVIDPFLAEYRRGRTPNPCALCNLCFKFGRLFTQALADGCDYVATGHYARAEEGLLKTNSSPERDESYFLALLPRERLRRLLLPLGCFCDREVSRLRDELLPGFQPSPVSQEACFLAGQSLRDFLRRQLPQAFRPGEIVSAGGKVLGQHQGTCGYTIGQRRGLSSASGRGGPYYVIGIEPEKNRIVVGRRRDLLAVGMEVRGTTWNGIANPNGPFRALVRIRHTHNPVGAEIFPRGEGRTDVVFERPQSAVTPGQLAVFYREDAVLGAGWIEGPLQED